MTLDQIKRHYKATTDAAVAEIIGTSRQVVSHWRKSKRVPDVWQRLLQGLSGGALKADRRVRR
jgi:hypothetical protein